MEVGLEPRGPVEREFEGAEELEPEDVPPDGGGGLGFEPPLPPLPLVEADCEPLLEEEEGVPVT